MKRNVAVFVILGLAITASAVAAGEKKPLTQWKCEDFLAVDEQFKPKAIYEATAVSKTGKPEDSVFDIDGTEKVIPIVISECQKAPQEPFWNTVKAAWKKVESEVKKAF